MGKHKKYLLNSLAVSHPELAKQWHPTKNLPSTPADVTFGMRKKIWWKCDSAADHEWEAFIYSRASGSGCPCCCGQKIVLSNCLATTNPEISAHWHPTKNFPLTPFDVTSGSGKKFWWKCNIDPYHEWEANVYNMTYSTGCPACAGQKTVFSNCLATTHPELSKEWHPTKNLPLTPFEVTAGSGKKIWWKCAVADDHEWQSTLCNRSLNKRGCPCCSGIKVCKSNCIVTTHPELIKQWHHDKNKTLTPFDVTKGSHKKIWWKCDVDPDHEWEAIVYKRINGNDCPYCCGKKVALSNCLATIYPHIAKEWHPTKNFPLTPFDVVSKSAKKIWWKCDVDQDHEWEASLHNRCNGTGCPCCSGHNVVISNCLAITHPEISKQWHPTKNFPVTSFDVVAGSHKKVWWKCDVAEDHEWESTICGRENGNGCPCCSGHKVVKSNCLATTHPEISKQWHHKNYPLTPLNVVAGSNKKVWWKCEIDAHEWKCPISNRTYQGKGCPCCNESHGEKEIKDVLYKMNISYTIEKKFDECKHKKKLPFDFYLPEYNALIEFDGMQHFEPIEYFGGIKNFNLTQKRDEIKNDFAAKNNIPLLRIPYTKFDSIENEIKSFISNLKLC